MYSLIKRRLAMSLQRVTASEWRLIHDTAKTHTKKLWQLTKGDQAHEMWGLYKSWAKIEAVSAIYQLTITLEHTNDV